MSSPGNEILEHLRGLGSPDLAAQVLEVFLQDTSTSLDALREAVGRRDGEAIYRIAHYMQGSTAMVGAASVSQTCAGLAAAGRSGSFDRCEALAAELIASFDAIQRVVSSKI